MNLLFDTNTLVWLILGDKRLSGRVTEQLRTAEDTLFVSVVSGWEYGQKRLRRPDEFPFPFEDLVARLPHTRLDLAFDVHRYSESLPLIHRDPFDRMLIAQALHHGFTLIASDKDIARYDVPVFW